MPIALLLAGNLGACGLISPDPPVPVEVRFRGYAPAAAATRAILTTSERGHTREWLGNPAVAAGTEERMGEVAVPAGDSLQAAVQVRDPKGALLAEARLARAIQANYDYIVWFQVGGRNPDLGGFCHQSPVRAALPGQPGDTLYLWWYGLPHDAVC